MKNFQKVTEIEETAKTTTTEAEAIEKEAAETKAAETKAEKEVPLDIWLDAHSQQLESNIISAINESPLPAAAKKQIMKNLYHTVTAQLDQNLARMYNEYQNMKE